VLAEAILRSLSAATAGGPVDSSAEEPIRAPIGRAHLPMRVTSAARGTQFGLVNVRSSLFYPRDVPRTRARAKSQKSYYPTPVSEIGEFLTSAFYRAHSSPASFVSLIFILSFPAQHEVVASSERYVILRTLRLLSRTIAYIIVIIYKNPA